MNTRKRLAAMRQARLQVPAAPALANPACVIGPGQRCEHALVDPQLNQRLYAYETRIRGRFAAISETLKVVSALQHERDFVERAQHLAKECLGYELPEALLADAWVTGLDLPALYAHCVFQSFLACVDQAPADQAPWRERLRIDEAFFQDCGYHTVDISPCADGRLQGLLPFVLRLAPNPSVFVKAYAGTLFDIEGDVADWTHRELDRLTGGIPGGDQGNYLKIAVYHYSTSHPCQQGCAAHGSNDAQAMDAALSRLQGLRAAVENTFGIGAAPEILLIGVDTDLDAIRIHLPDAVGDISPARYVCSASLYRETLGLTADRAQAHIEAELARVEGGTACAPGMRQLVLALLEANLSQIEYVIQHHGGRYAVIGHDEAFICAGEATREVYLRNQYYYAHLDTVEEGAPDMDVGIKIFTGLNVRHGLPVPVLVHYHYSSRVPGARERAEQRCRRVKAAIESRYPDLYQRGLLHCRMAVSDQFGVEPTRFIVDAVADAGH